jgi:serine/threonine-protein kinase
MDLSAPPLLTVPAVDRVEPFLRRLGTVFREFPDQDSGCRSRGVLIDGTRWFVKEAETPGAAASLRRASAVHAAIRHPAILAPRHHFTAGDGRPVLVYPWADGEVLSPAGADRADPEHPLHRFRRLPVAEILPVLEVLLDAHLAVEQAGFTAVDLYFGCVLHDFATGSTLLCDLDEYRPGPFRLDAERLPGSTRLMAPEEFRRGALIDSRTNVFTLGRMLRLLLDSGPETEDSFRGTSAQLSVTTLATGPDPSDRYPSIAALTAAWQRATT